MIIFSDVAIYNSGLVKIKFILNKQKNILQVLLNVASSAGIERIFS